MEFLEDICPTMYFIFFLSFTLLLVCLEQSPRVTDANKKFMRGSEIMIIVNCTQIGHCYFNHGQVWTSLSMIKVNTKLRATMETIVLLPISIFSRVEQSYTVLLSLFHIRIQREHRAGGGLFQNSTTAIS